MIWLLLLITFLEGCSYSSWPELENTQESLAAFKKVCDQPSSREGRWQSVCSQLTEQDLSSETTALAFWKKHFNVNSEPKDALVTGYYTPLVSGSMTVSNQYPTPIYRKPDSCSDCYTRLEIEKGVLDGQGLELIYVKDPIERYFIQIQGSAYVRLPSGNIRRLVYSGINQYPYRSIPEYHHFQPYQNK